ARRVGRVGRAPDPDRRHPREAAAGEAGPGPRPGRDRARQRIPDGRSGGEVSGVALFWRKVTLDEVLGAVRLELGARRPGDPLPREVVELSRLLRAEEAGFVAGGPRPDLQEIVEGIPDPAGILDPRGRFAVVNKAMDALVGTGRALGRTVLEITRSAELGDAAERASMGTPVRGEFSVASL